MRHFKFLVAGALLAGCGGGGGTVPTTITPVGTPGFSAAGLTYDLQSNGPNMGFSPTFSGLPETTNMPTTGSVAYTGTLRGSIDLQSYVNGTSTLSADFAAGTATIGGNIDLTGTAPTEGITAFSVATPINGNGFSFNRVPTPGNPAARILTVDGKFYGTSAEVAAGQVNLNTLAGNNFTGAFIVAK